MNASKQNPTLQDTRIREYINTSTPEWLWELLPRSQEAQDTVVSARRAIENIMTGQDRRKMLVIGPCSVHSVRESLEYTRAVLEIAKQVKDELLIIERVNIEKPRTLADWPGLLEDPFMDGSNDIETGRYRARELLLKITEMGMPCATEYVNTSTPQYIGDLVSWSWVGARTVESQMHKKMASGLSTGVGFKNNSRGDVDAAINAIITAASPNKFPGIKPNGREATVSTTGNPLGVTVLRGGDSPNHDRESIAAVQKKLKDKKLRPIVVVDCSHGNSGKDYSRQSAVFKDVVDQLPENEGIVGLMLESYIKEGSQKLDKPEKLKKGISVTDSCIGIEETIELIKYAGEKLKRNA
jgi:3-deoxy-7-phosphoheptulonate synthase